MGLSRGITSDPVPCKGAKRCVQFNADVVPSVPFCRKPRRTAAHEWVKDNPACRTSCQYAVFRQLWRIGSKMLALVRHGVDKPHVALSPDGRNHFVGYAAFFSGLVDILGLRLTGNGRRILAHAAPVFLRRAVVGAIGSAMACQS